MKRQYGIIGFCVLVLIILSTVALAEFYHRAPDVIPGTLPEMRNPSYWIDLMDKPDEVVLTPGQIQDMNKNYRKWISSPDPFKDVAEERIPELTYWWPGIISYVPDLHNLPLKAVADTVKMRIQNQIDYMRKMEFGSILGIKYRDQELDAFVDEMALDRVDEDVTVLDAISVRWAQFRVIPTFKPNQIGLRGNGETRWDTWNVGIVKIGRPVTVLHTSRSGEYVFVLSDNGYGWVRSEYIAFGDKEEIDVFANPKDFVVCTGDRVPFYSDSSCRYSSGWFGMGDRLPLASIFDSNTIKVPLRKMNGELAIETAYLAKDADVHRGWLPYTRCNVVVTAFKLLDNMYDFNGAWFGRQHETTYRDIFACFGFVLPRHGGMFTFYNNNETNKKVLPPDIGFENQCKEILKHEPFITLQSCGGHAQLFLGENDGIPIVLDQHGYGYKDDEGKFLVIRRCVIGDERLPTYFLTRKVTFLELR